MSFKTKRSYLIRRSVSLAFEVSRPPPPASLGVGDVVVSSLYGKLKIGALYEIPPLD